MERGLAVPKDHPVGLPAESLLPVNTPITEVVAPSTFSATVLLVSFPHPPIPWTLLNNMMMGLTSHSSTTYGAGGSQGSLEA